MIPRKELYRHVPVTELDDQAPANNKKELVLLLVVVPDELPLELGELHVAVVDLADDLGTPLFIELSQLFGYVDLVHGQAPYRFSDITR